MLSAGRTRGQRQTLAVGNGSRDTQAVRRSPDRPRQGAEASWDLFDRSGDEEDATSWGSEGIHSGDGSDDDEDAGSEGGGSDESESDTESDESDGEEEDEEDELSETTGEGGSWLRRATPLRMATGRGSGGRARGGNAEGRRRFKRKLYIQMEFCKRTLADILSEGPLPEEQVWRFLRQLLGGLQHVPTGHHASRPAEEHLRRLWRQLEIGPLWPRGATLLSIVRARGCRRRHAGRVARRLDHRPRRKRPRADGQNAANRAAGEGAERAAAFPSRSRPRSIPRMKYVSLHGPPLARAPRRSLTPTHW